MFHLGVCYDYGFGTVRDLAAAAEWYMKAARKGDATAQLNIARCLREGDGLEVDKEAAYSWYLKAAKEGGMAEAWLDVGYARFYGIGAEMDMIGAVDAYRRAAKAGVVAAQYNLGLCYKYGDGVRRNMAHALAWLRKAARGGHRRAEAIVKRITGTE
jgi:TPR repeat protein